MAKLTKYFFRVLMVVLFFIPFCLTAQVNYSPQKDKRAESVDRQEEKRIEQSRKANEKKKAELQRQNRKESERRMHDAQKRQKKAENYSVERDIKSRKVKDDKTKPTPEERLVMKLEKQKQREDAKKDKLAEKEHKKILKTYHKKVSGAGKDIANKKKVYKRMKKSKRIANKNNKR